MNRRHLYLGTWIIMGFVIASQYNACGQVEFSQSSESKVLAKSAAAIVINKDAMYTNSEQVEVGLDAHQADEVYVTNDSTCNSGGAWEPMAPARNWNLSQKNSKAQVFAKFRNISEGIDTECVSDDILHDNIAPDVVL
jgi:hypothetical protein